VEGGETEAGRKPSGVKKNEEGGHLMSETEVGVERGEVRKWEGENCVEGVKKRGEAEKTAQKKSALPALARFDSDSP